MADMTGFGYIPGDSELHTFDARFKLISLIVLSLSILNADLISLVILTFIIYCFFRISRIPVNLFFKTIKPFMFFIILVFLSHYVTGEKTRQIQILQLHLSVTAISEGLQASLRLFHVIALGFLFISTTRTTELKHAAGSLLKPVPFIPEKKAALMLSLMLRFFPEIMNITKYVFIALKSRCLGHHKNPVRKMKFTVIPVMRGALRKADTLVMAMESRCFTDQYLIKEMKSSHSDRMILFCIVMLCLLITCI